MPLTSVELIDGFCLRIVSIDQDFSPVNDHAPFPSTAAQCMMNVSTTKLSGELRPGLNWFFIILGVFCQYLVQSGG